MVVSPGDLYDLVEQPLSNLNAQGEMMNFGDQNDDPYRPDRLKNSGN